MTLSPAGERVKRHYQQFCGDGRRSIVVPEWSDEDGPAFVIYWKPFTVGDHIRFFGGEGKTDSGVYSKLVVYKAEHLDGKKIFAELEDASVLRIQADFSVVRRIAEEIMTSPTIQEFAAKLRDDAMLMTLHGLADRLGKTVEELEQMSVAAFRQTLAFHQVRKEGGD